MAGHLGVQLKADGPLSGFGVTKKASQLQLSHRVSQTPGETARQFNFSLCQEHTTEDSGFAHNLQQSAPKTKLLSIVTSLGCRPVVYISQISLTPKNPCTQDS